MGLLKLSACRFEILALKLVSNRVRPHAAQLSSRLQDRLIGLSCLRSDLAVETPLAFFRRIQPSSREVKLKLRAVNASLSNKALRKEVALSIDLSLGIVEIRLSLSNGSLRRDS